MVVVVVIVMRIGAWAQFDCVVASGTATLSACDVLVKEANLCVGGTT